jgi:thiosulfate dehydrogenase
MTSQQELARTGARAIRRRPLLAALSICALSASPAGWSLAAAADLEPASVEFTPPAESTIPEGDMGAAIRLGKLIFDDPSRHAAGYVGNDLHCSNCHLDSGRRAGSAPLWAAYVAYPAYRAKNKRVNTFADRLQDCFVYSMNGKRPPLGGPVLVALETYAYWMAHGARIDPNLPGRGYAAVARPPLAPDYERGRRVYAQTCALCHGPEGQGQVAADGSLVFPALWGARSFNWGAGMTDIQNAAAFIKANMPLGRAGSLSDQDSWDVAQFVDSQERPQDPRFTGSVGVTRAKFHNTSTSMYGIEVEGYVLGSKAEPPGGSLRKTAGARP